MNGTIRIQETRFLRGPNLYASTPCVMALLEIDMEPARAVEAACLVQRTVRELQEMAGVPAPYGCVKRLVDDARSFRVVCGFEVEEVAERALFLAVDFVEAQMRGSLFSVSDRLVELHAAAVRQVSASAGILMDEAKRRDIPVLELDDHVIQFGWGTQQTRISSSATHGALPEGDGRIPVIAITGTNGKTTTTLLVAHTVRLAGHTTGYTTTEGVFIDGCPVARGDCTGYWSARDILTAPNVEFAVLETARGGILKRGLAYDKCDVSVVLNVSADHLGLEGVETVEDLARVKGVVGCSAGKAAVLNAEDRHCVAMAAQLKPGVEVIYFSMDAENPVLLRHLEQGGSAVYLHDQSMVIADGQRHEELLRVEHMPVTMNGRARYNVANCLAATAALMAAGIARTDIAHGLTSFVSDGRSNPLRGNVFDVRGVTVIVDYAHNAAAYAALAGMARTMTRGKLVGIVTAPGDRRDSDLEEIGATCAERFDDIVVYESQSRGRSMGGTVEIIVRGAHAAPRLLARVHEEWVDIDAIRRGLDLCEPGDVLVFACGTSLATLVEALRVPDPIAAARIEAEIG